MLFPAGACVVCRMEKAMEVLDEPEDSLMQQVGEVCCLLGDVVKLRLA